MSPPPVAPEPAPEPASAPAAPATPRRPRVALVIGAGGLKCTAAVGLWKVLAREGIPIDLVVGCSGGAIYAAGIAMGADVGYAEELTLTGWGALFLRVDKRAVLRALLPRLLGYDARVGLLDDREIRRMLAVSFRDATFADCRLPLFLAATDQATGERVTLASGPIGDAVRASSALPILLPPVELDGRLLVDGGVSNPLPIDVALREGSDVILAMGFEDPPPRVTSIRTAIAHVSTLVTNQLLRATYAFAAVAHHAEVLPILPVFDRRIGLRDADAVPALIAAGERAAEAELPYLRRLLAAGGRGTAGPAPEGPPRGAAPEGRTALGGDGAG